MTRGEIYWADLVPRSASEQTGRRPMIVVSHDGFNRTTGWKSIIVVPISTSASQARRGPTVVELAGASTGLPKTSFAVCHQVTTLDRAKLTRKTGTLPPEFLLSVEEALKAAMDLD
jgi:mRNA interferase MazF